VRHVIGTDPSLHTAVTPCRFHKVPNEGPFAAYTILLSFCFPFFPFSLLFCFGLYNLTCLGQPINVAGGLALTSFSTFPFLERNFDLARSRQISHSHSFLQHYVYMRTHQHLRQPRPKVKKPLPWFPPFRERGPSPTVCGHILDQSNTPCNNMGEIESSNSQIARHLKPCLKDQLGRYAEVELTSQDHMDERASTVPVHSTPLTHLPLKFRRDTVREILTGP
jgi:hypothetical protein